MLILLSSALCRNEGARAPVTKVQQWHLSWSSSTKSVVNLSMTYQEHETEGVFILNFCHTLAFLNEVSSVSYFCVLLKKVLEFCIASFRARGGGGVGAPYIFTCSSSRSLFPRQALPASKFECKPVCCVLFCSLQRYDKSLHTWRRIKVTAMVWQRHLSLCCSLVELGICPCCLGLRCCQGF
jgi:hypothetical protein